jgi:hypothetical protein
MEKNTKILLGIGAAIVAYLILKPKKAADKKVVNNDLTLIELNKIAKDKKTTVEDLLLNRGSSGCACIMAPCNC